MTHQRTCDRQTLFLSSGKIASLLLNYRVQSAFSIKNNFISLRRMDRLFQFLLCGIFISPQQIFTDRTRKQHRFLQYNADLAAQLLQIIVPHIGTVHLHAAFAHIVEPRNQRNEGRFTGTGTSDDTDRLSFFHPEADVCQRIGSGIFVAETDMGKFYFRHLSMLRNGFFCAHRLLLNVYFPIGTFRLCRTLRPGFYAARCAGYNARFQFHDILNTVSTGDRLRHVDDQVRQLDQFDQDLRHIVDQRYDRTLA